ncbi:MAG: hypothetical protein AAGA77_00570 [Bacteroidota bacterium]
MSKFKNLKITSKLLIKSLLTLVPGVYSVFGRKSTHAKDVSYCYSVLLRHLTYLMEKNGGVFPNNIVEIGPGGSLGSGVFALLLGAKSYTAVDAKNHLGATDHIKILHDLIDLLQRKEPIPSGKFPNLSPGLDAYQFPDWLSDRIVSKDLLSNSRIKSLEKLLTAFEKNHEAHDDGLHIKYVTTVDYSKIEAPKEIDWIYSQAVMEHVPAVQYVYENCLSWLRPGGLMSHQIDYKSHGLAADWNGHWTYSNFVWKLINGNRTYLINRHPHSYHRQALGNLGFQVLKEKNIHRKSNYALADMNKNCNLKKEDVTTSGSFIIVQKPSLNPHA